MREPAVTDKIVKSLNAVYDCHARKRHSGKYGSGEPDVMGCYCGQAFFIEVKMLDGELTMLQANQLQLWQSARAITAVAIYDPKSKKFMFVRLDYDKEKWAQFIGPKKIKELWETTRVLRVEFKNPGWAHSWLQSWSSI